MPSKNLSVAEITKAEMNRKRVTADGLKAKAERRRAVQRVVKIGRLQKADAERKAAYKKAHAPKPVVITKKATATKKANPTVAMVKAPAKTITPKIAMNNSSAFAKTASPRAKIKVEKKATTKMKTGTTSKNLWK